MSKARKTPLPTTIDRRKRRSSGAAVRMEDVAATTGVSMITVSRALSSPHLVAAATLARVQDAVKSLGYVPNLMAGSLASSRSRIVGAIVPTIDNSIFSATIRALGERLSAAGYQLLLGQTNYEPKQEEALVAAFLGRRVDGLVLTGGQHSALTRRRIREAAVPVVETWDLPARPLDMVAGFSNFEAGRAVAQHFLAQGQRRLCFAGGPDERSQARLEGMQQAVAAVAGARLQVLRLPTGAYFEGGCDAVRQLQHRHAARLQGLPQALCCGNDGVAAGALFECQRVGWTVPGQLAMMGFADAGMAASMHPRLSSVRVPMQEMGELAATMLLARLAGREPESTRCDLGFSLALRDTG